MQTPFPADFLWGAATAAFQIEGATTIDGRGPSIWDVFCATPGKTRAGDTGEPACDHYRRWAEDVDLMRSLGLQAYRLSISWPRVMPTGRDAINQTGLDFYDRLIDRLIAANIQPMVTLYHWDLPAALQMELGGWTHPDLPHLFADYAQLIYDRLADRVKMWITINEPWCCVDGGYFHGGHAPGIRDRRLGYLAGHHLMRAHAYAVQRYRAHAHGDGKISFALNTTYSFPASEKPADRGAAERAMLDFGGWFTDPPYFGDYPAVMRERLGDLLPPFSADDTAALKGSMDYLALNYYLSDIVRHAPGAGPMEMERFFDPSPPKTEMGWPIVPTGFYHLLDWLSNRYPGLPVYITENGAACNDKPDSAGFVDDQDRIDYLADHLAVIAAARDAGVDVRGYFAWSLMDNLEWSEGLSKRFGIIRCDPQTQARIIKASGHWYRDVISENGAPALRRATWSPAGAVTPALAKEQA